MRDRPLRPYQQEAVDAILRGLHPKRPALLHLATGGGKTRVANAVVMHALEKGARVLWIAKDWELLDQAYDDLRGAQPSVRATRVGGGSQLGGSQLEFLQDGTWGEVVYTTIQTLYRRRPNVLSEIGPHLVVWDECHWGHSSDTGQAVLRDCLRAHLPLLGLTATPLADMKFSIVYSKDCVELIELGYLARPVLEEPVRTNFDWSPSFRLSEVTAASLSELAQSTKRNRCIVDHYDPARHRKTIVFACNIDHANQLASMFVQRGISARVVHSELPRVLNRQTIAAFRSGAVQVIVNVAMMTHGVDIPDVQTIFLCRPTASDILFAQMIGRGTRLSPGKTTFIIVEFTDNVQQHGYMLKTAQRYFVGATFERSLASQSVPITRWAPALREHAFDPSGAPTWIPDSNNIPEEIRGLWYRQGQTFGIEFELTSLNGPVPQLGSHDWYRAAESLRIRLASTLGYERVASDVHSRYVGSDGDKDCSIWNVEYDSSAGWEVTTPILSNQEGFEEVVRACRVLLPAAAELGLGVDLRTGTHVHLGWTGPSAEDLREVITLVGRFETALATLVSRSRVVYFDGQRYYPKRSNPYCKPISTAFGRDLMKQRPSLDRIRLIAESDVGRYVTLSLRPLRSSNTVEVRMHNGTLEADKILLWVSLWQQILWAASQRWNLIPEPDRRVIHPTGDIQLLAQEYLPDARQPQQLRLLQRLKRRSEDIRAAWRATPELAAFVR